MSTKAPINITGSLSDLQDIIVPESVGFFPPAAAWYAAGGIIAFLLIRGGVRKYKVFHENRYRRDAQKQLDLLEKIIITSKDSEERIKSATALPGLLKQTAISAYGRKTIAPLSQDKWLAFLKKNGSANAFSGKTGQLLSRCAYGTPEQINAVPEESFKKLISFMRKWIRKHGKEQA